MEHDELAKSHRILLFSHGNLPILPLNCTKFVLFFLATTKKLSSNVESLHFLIPQNAANAKSRREIWSWKIKKWSWKSHGTIFGQVCGNPVLQLLPAQARPDMELSSMCFEATCTPTYSPNVSKTIHIVH